MRHWQTCNVASYSGQNRFWVRWYGEVTDQPRTQQCESYQSCWNKEPREDFLCDRRILNQQKMRYRVTGQQLTKAEACKSKTVRLTALFPEWRRDHLQQSAVVLRPRLIRINKSEIKQFKALGQVIRVYVPGLCEYTRPSSKSVPHSTREMRISDPATTERAEETLQKRNNVQTVTQLRHYISLCVGAPPCNRSLWILNDWKISPSNQSF